ncbi:hypothetical protein BH09BAC6_BH09BAC6_11950 [soil metagenome]|jgi:hypothetical protein
MRKLFTTLLLLFMLILAACKSGSTADTITLVTIKHTELGRQTLFKITCDSFDKYFPDCKVKTLKKKKDIENLVNALHIMKSTGSDNPLDVRSKIFLVHANKAVDTVCVGVSFLKYNGDMYETPQELLQIIQQ